MNSQTNLSNGNGNAKGKMLENIAEEIISNGGYNEKANSETLNSKLVNSSESSNSSRPPSSNQNSRQTPNLNESSNLINAIKMNELKNKNESTIKPTLIET